MDGDASPKGRSHRVAALRAASVRRASLRESLRALVISEQLHRVEDKLALVRIGGLAEYPSDLHTVGRLKRARDGISPFRLGKAGRAVVFLQLVIEILDWHAEDARDLIKAASADAVRAFLVFLDLLECNAE